MADAFKLGRAVYELETDSNKFDKGIDSAEGKTKKLGGAFGKLGAAGKVMSGVVAGTVVGALSDFARAAIDDEANVAKLQQSIENSGVSWDDYSGKIDAAVKSGQDLAFSDDQVRNALAEMTESTGSAEEALKRLPAAMDLARAKSIPLEQASKLLGRVSDENTGVLRRMGVVLGEGADATAVLGAVQQKFAGQAEKYGSSTKGSIDKVKDSIGEFTEGIGASLGPAQGLIAMLPGLSSGMSIAGGAVASLTENTKFMTLAKQASIPVMKAVQVATSAMLGPIGLIIIAIGALYLAWTNNWGDIQGKTAAVVAFLGELFAGFQIMALEIWRGLLVGVAGVINGVIGVVNGFIEAYNTVAEKLGLPLIGKIELVTPNLEAVDAEIDRVARSRTASIFANVYERAITGGGGIRQYATGTPFVPETGLAILHRGEAVIPASENLAALGRAESFRMPAFDPGPREGHAHDIVLDGNRVSRTLNQRMARELNDIGRPTFSGRAYSR